MLLARFRPGESAYTELVGRPRLYAIVTIDRELRFPQHRGGFG